MSWIHPFPCEFGASVGTVQLSAELPSTASIRQLFWRLASGRKGNDKWPDRRILRSSLGCVVITPRWVLRWSYSLAERRCHCELSLDAQHRMYRFRVRQDGGEHAAVDYCTDISQAFRYQSELEAVLLEGGCALDGFRSIDLSIN
jgi:hypothetical protein